MIIGATGQALVQQLLDNPDYSKVTVFVRRAMSLQHPKLTVEVIDFDQLQTWQDKVRGDVLFSCLGTTLKLQAEIEEYLVYHNQKRIKPDLKGLSPAQYRAQYLRE